MFSSTRERRNLNNSTVNVSELIDRITTIENSLPVLEGRVDDIENPGLTDLTDRVEEIEDTLVSRVEDIESGLINATLDPGSDDTYDLGTSTNMYRQIFVKPVYRSYTITSQSITTTANIPITWGALVDSHDPDDLIVISGTNFIFPVAGVYDYTCNIQFNGDDTGGFRGLICELVSPNRFLSYEVHASTVDNPKLTISSTFVVAANQQIVFKAYQNSGSTQTLVNDEAATNLLITFRGYL